MVYRILLFNIVMWSNFVGQLLSVCDGTAVEWWVEGEGEEMCFGKWVNVFYIVIPGTRFGETSHKLIAWH